jgi:hypothetical protein
MSTEKECQSEASSTLRLIAQSREKNRTSASLIRHTSKLPLVIHVRPLAKTESFQCGLYVPPGIPTTYSSQNHVTVQCSDDCIPSRSMHGN